MLHHIDPYLYSLKPDTEDLYNSLDVDDRWIVDKTISEIPYFPDRAYWDKMLIYERNTIVAYVLGKIELPFQPSYMSGGDFLAAKEKSEYDHYYNGHHLQENF